MKPKKLPKDFDIHTALQSYIKNKSTMSGLCAEYLAEKAKIDAKYSPFLEVLEKNIGKAFDLIETWSITARADWPSKSTTIGQVTLGFRDTPPKVDLLETVKDILKRLPEEAVKTTKSIDKEFILSHPERSWLPYGIRIAQTETFFINLGDTSTNRDAKPVASV